MRGWIRLGLVVTALWVVGSIVTVVHLGTAPGWGEVKAKSFADWHRQTVETETGRSLAEWDLQIRVARETCLAGLARKSISPERQTELCAVSPFYAEPSRFEWIGIYLGAVANYAAAWVHEFLLPVAIWAIFVPFCVWFIAMAGALFVLRLRGDRPHSAERHNRIIH